MRISLRMVQEREPWQQIVDLVADEHLLKRLARAKSLVSDQYMYDGIFVYLADHWVVHAELNLDRTVTASQERLTALLKDAGFEVEAIDGSLIVDLDGYPVRINVEERGNTRFTTLGDHGMETCVRLKEESVVMLLRFIGYALPVIAGMAESVLIEEEKEKMASTIYGQALHAKLTELGETFKMVADPKFVSVQVQLILKHKLQFCVHTEDIPEMVEKIEGLIAAANLLSIEYWKSGMRII